MIWYYSDIEGRYKAETQEYCAIVLQVLNYWSWQLYLKNANDSVGIPFVNRRLRCHAVAEAQAECEKMYQVMQTGKRGIHDIHHAQFVGS